MNRTAWIWMSLVGGMAVGLMFRLCVDLPIERSRGELYGPVVYFRPYVYATSAAAVLLGLAGLLLQGTRSRR